MSQTRHGSTGMARSSRLVLALSAATLTLIVASLLLDGALDAWLTSAGRTGAGALAVWTLVGRMSAEDGRGREAWRWLAWASGAWLAGQLVWDVYLLTGSQPGSPSLATPFWLLFPAGIMLAGNRRLAPGLDRRLTTRLDRLALWLASCGLGVLLFVENLAGSPLTWPGQATSIAYSALYLMAFIGLVHGIVQQRDLVRSPSWMLVVVGVGLESIAFVAWTPTLLAQTYRPGHSYLDLLWTAGLVSLALAATWRNPGTPAGPATGQGRMGSALLPAAVFVMLLVAWPLAVGAGMGTRLTLSLTAIGVGITFGVRFYITIRETERGWFEARRAAVELDTFFELIPEIMVTAGFDGRFKRTNRFFDEMLGKSMVDEVFLDHVHPDDRPATIDEVARLGAGDETFSFQNRFARADGTYRWVEWQARASDQTGLMYAAGRDVTERNQLDEELARLLAENSLILSNAGAGIFRLDGDRRVTYVNPAVTTLTGWKAEDLVGRDMHEVIHHSHADGTPYPAEICPIFQAFDGTARNVDDEVFWHRDGTCFPVHYSCAPTMTGERVTGLVIVFTDVTAQRTMTEELRSLSDHLEERVQQRTRELEVSNRELEAFSYSVSHDLRAPLRAINGFGGILASEHGDELSPEAARYVELMRGGARSMGQLVDELLAFSRLGRQELVGQEVDVEAVVSEVVESAELGDGVEITIDALPPCRADPGLLRQVFVNLIENAAKYSAGSASPAIHVGASAHDGDAVAYFVADNGIGFDPAYGEKVFGVFERLHHGDEFEGTGVGLAIVRRIVERHGGRVWAEGIPGDGATFRFTIGDAAPPDDASGTQGAV